MNCQIQNPNCEKYHCIICMDLAKRPISCEQCHKLVCYHHIYLLYNKCPHCRLEPFRFKEETLIQSFIEIEIKRRRDKMKRENVFKCLVSGCSFEGKYQAMKYHQKSRHFQENIEEMIFPEERQKKLRRDALKRLFVDKFAAEEKTFNDKALEIYIKTKGIYELPQIVKMVKHVHKCASPSCKMIVISEAGLQIGAVENHNKVVTQCQEALQLHLKI